MNLQEFVNPIALSVLAHVPRPESPGAPFAQAQQPRHVRRPRRAGEPEALYVALVLHPGLSDRTQERLEALLGVSDEHPIGHPQTIAEGERFQSEESIFLVVEGTAKGLMVAPDHQGHCGRMFAAYRSGCWVGLEQAMIQLLGPSMPEIETLDDSLGLEVVASERCRVLAVPMAEILAWMKEEDEIRALAELAVAHFLPTGQPWQEALDHNPLLSMLDRWDRELLWQTAVLRRYDSGDQGLYLPLGSPATRCALLLEGSAQLYIGDVDGDGLAELVGAAQPGDDLGLETLATPDELGAWQKRDNPLLTDDPMGTAPLPRRSSIYLTDQALVLEFDWRVVRWLFYGHQLLWERLCAYLLPGTVQVPQPPADVVLFLSSRPNLGTRTLAQSAAVALARTLADEEMEVALIDVKPPSGALRLQPESQQELQTLVEGEEWVEGFPGEGRPALPHCALRVVLEEGQPLWVSWCREPSRTAELAELLQQEGQMRIIVVAIANLAAIASGEHEDCDGLLDQEGAKQLVRELNRLGAGVVWLTDDPYVSYNLTPERPEILIRAERLNATWVARERLLQHRRFEDWLQTLTTTDVAQSDRPIDHLLADLKTWEEHGDSARDPSCVQAVDHVLRVPEDPDGARAFEHESHDHFFAEGYPLAQAGERLARMLLGRTVGIALGGGGAWGFSQIPLLRQLTDQGLPIDYISGTSFGALVAGMFAASGLDGLEAMLKTSDPAWEHRLKRWADGTPLDGFVQASINTVKRLGPLRTVLDLSSSTMNSHATSALVDSTSLQLLVDGMMELAIGDGAYPMSTTPIPYLPVGTGVFSGDQVVTFHGTVGHGARSASCLPPAYPALRLRDERLLDGALVAFVPAEELSRVGADFIVSCNVIPPDSSLFDVGELDALFDRAQTTAIRRTLEHFQGTPLPQQRSALERQMRWRYRLSWVRACMAEMAALRGALPEQLALKLKDLLFVRFIDAIHGFYLMSWKSGEDQSRLVAHCVVDMRPEEYQVFEFWRGRAIAADFDARLRAMEVAERITAIWRRPELWRGQPARTFTVTKPVATDAQPRT